MFYAAVRDSKRLRHVPAALNPTPAMVRDVFMPRVPDTKNSNCCPTLHSRYGNQAVLRLLARSRLPQPGEPYPATSTSTASDRSYLLAKSYLNDKRDSPAHAPLAQILPARQTSLHRIQRPISCVLSRGVRIGEPQRATSQPTSGSFAVAPQASNPSAAACAQSFHKEGTGLTKQQLGRIASYVFATGIEIQFAYNFASSFPNVHNIRPSQWAGPESLWIKKGNPLETNWLSHKQDLVGAGPDDPLPDFVFKNGNVVAFYDSPGPTVPVLNSLPGGTSRLVSKQNFTATVVGEPPAGGLQHLCTDIAWHSTVSLVNAEGQWTFLGDTDAGIGWVDVSKPPESV